MSEQRAKLSLGVNTLFLVPGDVGGTEVFLRETLKALAEAGDIELVLFTTRDNDHLLREDLHLFAHVTFRKLGFSAANRPLRILFEQTLLPLACLSFSLDCLWSPGYTAPFWAPCPQAVTIPDLQYKSYPEDMSGLERYVLDSLVRIACKTSRIIFAISEFSKREIIKYGFASEEKIQAILLGVDQSFGIIPSKESREESLRDLIPLDRPYILCVAHSYPHKNVHLLVEAFTQLIDILPHNLVLVGKPRRGENNLLAAINRLPNKERLIRFTSGLPAETLQRLYQCADIFVLPSSYEGFGLPVIEAMMAGVPVVTSREGSLPEVGGEHAVYVDSVSADSLTAGIQRVAGMTDEERRRRIDQGRQWATGFTWQRSARQLHNIISQQLHI